MKEQILSKKPKHGQFPQQKSFTALISEPVAAIHSLEDMAQLIRTPHGQESTTIFQHIIPSISPFMSG